MPAITRVVQWCEKVLQAQRQGGGFTKAEMEGLCRSKDRDGCEDRCMVKGENGVTVRVTVG